MAVKTSKFKITVNKERCKGCEICVAFCPHKVLIMESVSGGKAKVYDPDACTGCQLCEIYCPDFAITVDKKDEV